MSRVAFVTGSAGGVGVETLQQGGTLRKLNGGSRIVLNSSPMGAAKMSLQSDKLHNDFLANGPDAIPDENNITVQGILEKSQTTTAVEPILSFQGEEPAVA